jgi:elongator complex protein 4
VLEKANTSLIQWADEYKEDTDDYKTLLNELQKVVVDGGFSSALPVAPGTTRHALRVAIHSIASPSWYSKTPYVSMEIRCA